VEGGRDALVASGEMGETADNRQRELAAVAPVVPRKVWKRVGDRAYLCATVGAEFDQWQRRLAAVSAADAYFAQRIGLDAVERLMDELEAEIRPTLVAGEVLKPRRSPGYGAMPLELSREIIDVLDATKAIGVSLTESLLLVPSKSVTAICEIEKGEKVRKGERGEG